MQRFWNTQNKLIRLAELDDLRRSRRWSCTWRRNRHHGSPGQHIRLMGVAVKRVRGDVGLSLRTSASSAPLLLIVFGLMRRGGAEDAEVRREYLILKYTSPFINDFTGSKFTKPPCRESAADDHHPNVAATQCH